MVYQLPMLAPVLGPRVTRIPGFVKTVLGSAQKDVFTDYELEAFEAPLREPERGKVSAKYYRSLQLHDLPQLVRGRWRSYRLTTPTLMLYGTGDFAITRSALEGYEPYADDMRIESIEGIGHFVVDARPDVVAQRALDFFSAR
jgi:pimeloyl-ACP methyl ester carboxylesterase